MRWQWKIPDWPRPKRWMPGWPQPPPGSLKRFMDLFRAKHYSRPDELFFAIDELPAMGKEYWFLQFCAPPGLEQVVITAGRSVDSVQVNKTAVKSKSAGAAPASGPSGSGPSARSALASAADPPPVSCAAVCWYYSKKRRVVIDSLSDVRMHQIKGGHRLSIAQGKRLVEIKGRYPHYQITLVHNGKTVFMAHAHKSKLRPSESGAPYEMVHLLKNPIARRFGAAMVNYYFDFEGTLEGKPLCGKAYLQKVVAVMPLAPWNWVRIHFSGGGVLDFFAGKPLGNSRPAMHFECNDYLEVKGRKVRLGNVSLTSWLEGEKRRWLLSGPHCMLAMESYALQTFSMKQKTKFEYDEYLVKVTDFVYMRGTTHCTLKDLGPGVGLVEDARGYLI